MERVAFMTNESGDDLIVSFALSQGEPGEVRSLILQRTPKYEFLFDETERGVSFSDEARWEEEDDWVRSIDFSREVVRIETQYHEYTLDVSGVEMRELKQAEKILRKMNFDNAFILRIV
jgi:hypothetical protein